jgi:antirestriction protein ArdC
MTYKQSQALGGHVREGERSQIAIFYKSFSKTVESPVTGDATDEMRRVLRSYAVFNADQIDGLPEKFYPRAPSASSPPTTRYRIARSASSMPFRRGFTSAAIAPSTTALPTASRCRRRVVFHPRVFRLDVGA